MKKIKLFTFVVLTSLTLPAFAVPMAQRGCNPDDLQIQFNSAVETRCEWLSKNDASLQVTLHAKQDVPLINATCIFTPGAVSIGNKIDAVVDVQGHKAAEVKNLLIKKNVINFEVYNDNSEPNLNVIFYLNKTDNTYTPGDKIHCSFSDAN